ncbi:MAG: sulfate ABC transporter permease [Deltaproteobacteria bacterium]|nr:sulfate ABC transporter permease [Deltaproteobacteria bacterium]
MHSRRFISSSPRPLRVVMILATLAIVGTLLILPLVTVVTEALGRGASGWLASVTHADMISAVYLSLGITAFVVVANSVFGVGLAWLVTRHQFRGRAWILAATELPLAASPVVSGLLVILLYGRNGLFGEWLAAIGVKIVFAWPAVALATLFVTLPYVAKELVPFMEAQGSDEELAASVLGASAFQTFVRITMPKIKWGLVHGVLLASARSIGEFGAVSVVSGHIRGETNTVPLHVEVVYNEYDFVGAFAAASVLSFFAVGALGVKTLLERAGSRALKKGQEQV